MGIVMKQHQILTECSFSGYVAFDYVSLHYVLLSGCFEWSRYHQDMQKC